MATRARFSDGRPTTTTRETMAAYDRKVFTPTLPTMQTGIHFISDSDVKREKQRAWLAEKIRRKKIEDRNKRLRVLAERAASSERPVTTNLGNQTQRSYSKNLSALSSAPPILLRSRTEEKEEEDKFRESLGEGEKRHWHATEETYDPAKLLKKSRRTQKRGGKRKRHKTRKRRKKRRKHFKGGLFERPGIGIKAGLFPVRIKTENSTDDTKTWDPCWKVSTRAHRGWIVDKGMESRVVPTKEIKPQGMRSKKHCYISGGKRRKTRRRKKHKRRRRTHKK